MLIAHQIKIGMGHRTMLGRVVLTCSDAPSHHSIFPFFQIEVLIFTLNLRPITFARGYQYSFLRWKNNSPCLNRSEHLIDQSYARRHRKLPGKRLIMYMVD